MKAAYPNDLSQSLAFGLQGFDTIKSDLRSGTPPRSDEMAMLGDLWRPVAMNETGRFGKLDHPARRNLEARTRGAAELLFDGVPKILQQMEAVGHLPRLWRPSGGTLRVQTATVTADHLDGRVPLEPAGGRIR